MCCDRRTWSLKGCRRDLSTVLVGYCGTTACSSSAARPRTQSSAISRSERSHPTDGGGALAIVNGRSLRRRAPDGVWSTIATTELDLACCVAVGDVIYVGTDDARVLRVGADGALEQLRGFDAVAGRETWYAGSAVINGQRVGPPLGIRSITATPDGAVLLANVHVGGVPRSTDGGATWQPTIDVESDVHEVRAHPNRSGVVMAAAAIGLCTSRDGGVTWDVEQAGLACLVLLRGRVCGRRRPSCPHR